MAEFRCRHTTADVLVWRVDGSLISLANPPPDITAEFISGGSKLTIVGRPEYDGTEVVCVAKFFSSSPGESTNLAILRGMCNTKQIRFFFLKKNNIIVLYYSFNDHHYNHN